MPAEDPPQEGLPHAAPPPGGWETVHRHFRFPVTLPILCRAGHGEAGSSPRFWFSRTVNLSAVGTALLFPESLAPGARVGLLLELEGRTLEFEATVQWVGAPIPPDQEVPHGLVFGMIRPADRAHLDAFLLRLGREVKRRYARVTLELPVTVERAGGAPLRGRTVDIGEGGVQLILPAALPPETVLTLSFATSRGPVRVEASVRWVGTAREGEGTSTFPHGCQFTSQTGGEQLAAGLYIEEFLRRARGEAPS